MRLLLNNGASVEATGGYQNNETPLFLALKQRDLRAMIVLLNGGADRKAIQVGWIGAFQANSSQDPPNDEWKRAVDSLTPDMTRVLQDGLSDEELLSLLYKDQQQTTPLINSRNGTNLTENPDDTDHIHNRKPGSESRDGIYTELPEKPEDAEDSTKPPKLPKAAHQRARELAMALAKKETLKIEEDKAKLMKTTSQLAAKATKQTDLISSQNLTGTPIEEMTEDKKTVKSGHQEPESTCKPKNPNRKPKPISRSESYEETIPIKRTKWEKTSPTSSSGTPMSKDPKVKNSPRTIPPPTLPKITDEEVEEEMKRILSGLAEDLDIDSSQSTPRTKK